MLRLPSIASREASLARPVVRSSIPPGMDKSKRAVMVLQLLPTGPVARAKIDLISQDDKAGMAAVELGAHGDEGSPIAIRAPGTPSANSAKGLVPSSVSVSTRMAR
jgi:hypothetical protein